MGRTAGIWPYVCLTPALVVFVLLEVVPAFATSIFSLTDYTGLPGAASSLKYSDWNLQVMIIKLFYKHLC